ncbi:hypothetical protein JL193_00050 [Polaribacter batillariae]|uniref:Uncharacterized protein n=1 Tax=Polaribacter batillariae TaxID=2808900 RepID=A0ABX7SU33_9FLAO|nr:hypothetical protein [Polaribacter batillariae]QTD37745.1 hypothetical protein JL193_00050 [Polaribacter batillariae]
MEQENDFIQREIKKIILFFESLLSKLSGASSKTEQSIINNFDTELKEKLSVGFFEMLSLENNDLKLRIKEVDILILENLVIVLYEIYKNKNLIEDKFNLKRILLIIIDRIEYKSRTFSLERQKIKNNLKL